MYGKDSSLQATSERWPPFTNFANKLTFGMSILISAYNIYNHH